MMRRVLKFLHAVGGVVRARASSVPFMVSHRITARCNCRCETCLWRADSPVYEEKETDRIIKAYESASNSGIISATLWGGEPLLRDDIVELCEGIRNSGITLGLITNGYLLPEKIEVCRHLDYLIVSLDYADERHDELRKRSGVFERAVDGIKEARKLNNRLKIMINTVVSVKNGEDALEVAHLAAKLGVGVVFESTNEGETLYDGRIVSLRLPREKERRVFRKLMRLKGEGLPVLNSYTYLRMLAGGKFRYRCHIPKLSIGVGPDGVVSSCLDRKKVFGNFYYDGLDRIIGNEGRRLLGREAERCCRCVDTGCAETSLFWDGTFEVVMNTFRLFVRR